MIIGSGIICHLGRVRGVNAIDSRIIMLVNLDTPISCGGDQGGRRLPVYQYEPSSIGNPPKHSLGLGRRELAL